MLPFPAEKGSEAEPPGRQSTANLGDIVRNLRRGRKMTLQDLSGCSGLAPSTISKIENGHLSPTYDNILRLATGLRIDVAELFAPASDRLRLGRRAVTRRGDGVSYANSHYNYEMLCADLAEKRFIPIHATIRARSPEEFQSLISHRGEEFFYVLSGAIELHTQHYRPLLLRAGDSCYFDSTMGHALCSVSEDDATILWISSHADFQ